jgi:hypothetical protein
MSGGHGPRDLASLQKQAELKGCTFYEGAPDLLLLDLDEPSALTNFQNLLPLLAEHLPVEEVERWRSSGGIGTHVVLRLTGADLSISERACHQACLGSDPKRELLAILHASDGTDLFPGLFKPKKA